MKTLFKSTMLAGALLAIVSTTQAQWSAVDDFESLALGDINGQSGWASHDSLTLGPTSNAIVIVDPAGGGPVTTNKVLRLADNTTAYRGVTIPDLTTGTLFLRFRTSSNHAGTLGMSDTLEGTSIGFPQIESYLNMQPLPTTAVFTRDGSAGAVPVIPSLPLNTWFNIWFVIDNSSDTTTFYVNSGFRQGAGAGDMLTSGTVSNFVFRTAYAFGNPMVNFVIKSQLAADNNNPAEFYIDDVYVDASGSNLGNPIPAVNATDTDGDGLPDSWEMQWFTSLTTATATSDSNSDGMTDLQCYLASVNPTLVQPLLSSFTVRGYRTNLIQVPKGAGFALSWHVLPAPTVSVTIDQGVGNVLPSTVNGVGSITATNDTTGTHTYSLIVSNSANSAVATGTVQVVTMPEGVGFLTFSDLPYGSIAENSPFPSDGVVLAGAPAGIIATTAGTAGGGGWAYSGATADSEPRADYPRSFLPDTRNLWIWDSHGTSSTTDDATIVFSAPVGVASFDWFNAPWGGVPDGGSPDHIEGRLGTTVVWTFDPPADADGNGDRIVYSVTAGAGLLVDNVGFRGMWSSVDNMVLETTAGAANHETIQFAKPVMQDGQFVSSWNSQPGWIYSMQTASEITGEWNSMYLNMVVAGGVTNWLGGYDGNLIPSGGTTSTHRIPANNPEAYYRILRAP